jgi:hypothetical protein
MVEHAAGHIWLRVVPVSFVWLGSRSVAREIDFKRQNMTNELISLAAHPPLSHSVQLHTPVQAAYYPAYYRAYSRFLIRCVRVGWFGVLEQPTPGKGLQSASVIQTTGRHVGHMRGSA